MACFSALNLLDLRHLQYVPVMGCIECKGGDELGLEAGEKDHLLKGSRRQYSVAYPELPVDPHVHVQVQHAHSRLRPPPVDRYTRDSSNELQVGGALKSKVSRTFGHYASDKDIKTRKGQEILTKLCRAYRWKSDIEESSQEFLTLVSRLYMECQLHLTALASRGDVESKREADAIVNEMVALRNYWGPGLLPNSTCNAFVRERIPLTLGVEQRQFRIDCAQFFEPVPFYGNQQTSCPGELMKLYRFSVYNVARNEVVLRYYLERSNVSQLYHVLCFMDDNCHGQVKPYGTEPPSYWEVRQSMLEDLNLRLLNTLSPDTHPPPQPLAVTVFPTDRVYN